MSSAELARTEYCGATKDRYSCVLETAHLGPHVAGGVPGAPGVAWNDPRPVEPLLEGELVIRLPSEAHDFPEKRIASKVSRATRPYLCTSLESPAGHTATIAEGTKYLRVTLRPAAHESGSWRARPLCRACALHYRLATIKPEGGSP